MMTSIKKQRNWSGFQKKSIHNSTFCRPCPRVVGCLSCTSKHVKSYFLKLKWISKDVKLTTRLKKCFKKVKKVVKNDF